MKEFSTLVKIKKVNSSSDPIQIIADNFNFEPVDSESKAGILYDCSLTLYTDSLDVLKPYPYRAIISISDTQGKEYQIGSSNNPAIVLSKKFLNRNMLKISCFMTKTPL